MASPLLATMHVFDGMFDGLLDDWHWEAMVPEQEFLRATGPRDVTFAVAGEYAVLSRKGRGAADLVESATGAAVPPRKPEGTLDPFPNETDSVPLDASMVAAFYIARPGTYRLTVTGAEGRVLVLRTQRVEDPELAEYREQKRKEREADAAPPEPAYLAWAAGVSLMLGLVLFFVGLNTRPGRKR